MSYIRAPFNFVPLSDKVYFPEWAGQISQDIPFSDGLSGAIGLTITAESPIFIRNGHTKDDEPDPKKGKQATEEYKSFSHIDGPDGKPVYFIPATSIKGEVRTLLEIMSFSKMTVDKRTKFARRDLNNRKLYPLMNDQNKIRCGWLRKNKHDSGYTISDCGRPMRISQPEIDKYIGRKILTKNFSKEANKEKLSDSQKTATYKYKLLEGEKLDGLTFSDTGEKRRDGAVCVKYDPDGDITGSIVLTGQPDKWKSEAVPGRGKYYEFVFPDYEIRTRDVSKKEFEFFSFIYSDSEDWPRIKLLLESGQGVPVFFRVHSQDQDRIGDFGMAYLYKLPYENSVEESLPKNHRKHLADLAQCIFGYIDNNDEDKERGNKNIALKGRVQFGNAFAKPETVRLAAEKSLPLGTPHASYLPIYIRQGKSGGQLPVDEYSKKGAPHYLYKTYDNSTPSGWKRYHVRNGKTWGEQADVNADGIDTQNTLFTPIDKDAIFCGTISFHNLRPVELGALLCALKFADMPNCHHQLGQAKSYGYGLCRYDVKLKAVKLASIKEGETETTSDLDCFINLFQQKMTDFLGGEWIEQENIVDLMTMASCAVSNDDDRFQYMNMSTDRDANEFVNAQKEGKYLPFVTKLPHMGEFKDNLAAIERQKELKALESRWDARIEEAETSGNPKDNLRVISRRLTEELSKKDGSADLRQVLRAQKEKCGKKIATITEGEGEPETLREFFKDEAKTYIQFEGRIKNWLKKEHRTQLTEEEQQYAFEKLKEAHEKTSSNKAERNNWKIGHSFYKKCSILIGKPLATEWFNKLNQ